MCSAEPACLAEEHRQLLLDTARSSIEFGVAEGRPHTVEAKSFPEPLRPHRATFVTLRRPDGGLRGCMGTSVAARPLVEDVCRNAYSAAFMDPRFAPVGGDEVEGLDLQISVLSPLEQMQVTSTADLLAAVRPGVDGLLIEEGSRRGTLLPSVWEVLPDPVVFLSELWAKAGMSPGHWAPTLRVFRYTAECFP